MKEIITNKLTGFIPAVIVNVKWLIYLESFLIFIFNAIGMIIYEWCCLIVHIHIIAVGIINQNPSPLMTLSLPERKPNQSLYVFIVFLHLWNNSIITLLFCIVIRLLALSVMFAVIELHIFLIIWSFGQFLLDIRILFR